MRFAPSSAGLIDSRRDPRHLSQRNETASDAVSRDKKLGWHMLGEALLSLLQSNVFGDFFRAACNCGPLHNVTEGTPQ
jgi:hypothetical protein